MLGRLNILVSKDMMEAIGVVDPLGEIEITEDYIKDSLNECGIKAGVQRPAIAQILAEKEYNKEYVLAVGQPAKPGADGFFTYNFEVEKKAYKPKILEDGSVDYSIQRELVKQGQLLATYTPSVPGHFGYTVYAAVLAPVPPKELPELRVSGVVKRENQYFAATNGEATLKDGTISVLDVLTIDGDATVNLGLIKYTGDVHVKGDVLAAAKIEAEGSVVVDGVVEGASIVAGKSIIVKEGIHGNGKAILKAGLSVSSHFIEEANITAGDIITFDSAYYSTLSSETEIIGEGKLGNIIGGTATAKHGIKVKTAGNENEVRTTLRIAKTDDYIHQNCSILIEKDAFLGAQLQFGDTPGPSQVHFGDYHFISGGIVRYEIGQYVPIEYKKVEADVEAIKKKVILLVDDEPIILKTFYSYLSEDYTVMAVNSARDAFALMENTVPDLILLDYNMPKMDGGQMLEQMRKITWKKYHDVPVIFATAVTDRSVVAKVLSLYPQGYVVKPLSKDDLKGVVDKFFLENSME